MSNRNTLIKLSADRLERMAADIDEKGKKAAHKLAEIYGPVLDKMNDVVFITDNAGYFIFVNKASEKRTGIPAEALIGLHFLDIIDSRYHEVALNHFQQVLSGEKVPAIEMERRTASGEKATVEVVLKVLPDEGEAPYLMGTSRDISDRVRTQEVLKNARDELEMIVEARTAELKKANKLLMRQINERIHAEDKLRETEQIIADLKGELRDRKLVNRAKAIIAKRYNISDNDAIRLLQRESRKQNRKLIEVAQAVISSKFILE